MRCFFVFTLLIFTFIFSSCSSAPEANVNSNVKANNTNVAAVNSNSPLNTTKTPETATSNNAPTLAPIVANFYQALEKKDEAGAKKHLSATALKYWEDEAKTEKTTWLAYLAEIEEPLDEKREVRNEKIEGETAVAEIKGGSSAVWTKIKFVKENGEWKFASPKESLMLEEVKPASSNSTASK